MADGSVDDFYARKRGGERRREAEGVGKEDQAVCRDVGGTRGSASEAEGGKERQLRYHVRSFGSLDLGVIFTISFSLLPACFLGFYFISHMDDYTVAMAGMEQIRSHRSLLGFYTRSFSGSLAQRGA